MSGPIFPHEPSARHEQAQRDTARALTAWIAERSGAHDLLQDVVRCEAAELSMAPQVLQEASR